MSVYGRYRQAGRNSQIKLREPSDVKTSEASTAKIGNIVYMKTLSGTNKQNKVMEKAALDRHHRMGSTNNALTTKFLASNE